MVEMVGADAFSYADPNDPPFKKFLIHTIEHLTGQPYLLWLYQNFTLREGETFWDAAVRLLEMKVSYDAEKLARWPKTGPLVVVCNHPYGVLDGIVSCAITGRARPDFKVLTNAVICKAEPLRPYLLPIDFNETEEAVRTNLKSRNEALAHLKDGGCILIFPAGAVSTTPKWWHSRAVDSEWKTFTAKLIATGKAPVAPLYFAGQNSRLFQLVSHISLTLRLSLLFHEVHNKLGSEVRAAVGDVIPYETLAAIKDRKTLMEFLREETYRAGAHLEDPPKTRERRPKSAPPPGTLVPGLS
ncbi:putative hemolysin [Rhizomicrobium palustre]|uniref:Putative hemolysin n=1 Tax=Rhizomicrobium palustre TaxID=189966 RepID=A0A846MVH1_9PROT|nr:lysophospholipid acyltransferase family protein [Rhizomicrobium palustre]NIK87366.1 putative hemolysin [Rhizomicrobium palustre]